MVCQDEEDPRKGKMGDAKKLKNKEAEVYNKVKSLHQQFPQGLSETPSS